MKYKKTFMPKTTRLEEVVDGGPVGRDRRDGAVYVYTEFIVLAVRVAIATGRPLLLYGPPGSGKSSIAAFVARTMGWNYFEQVVTSRTRAQDLQWDFDAVRRLRDAKAGEANLGMEAYLEPRVLWWAFDPESAGRRGLSAEAAGKAEPPRPPGVLRGTGRPNVVLIDEIDKADPDVPNDLLVVLGSQRIEVSETGLVVEPRHSPLIIITTNDERDLPRAFLRRCVVHTLSEPTKERLVEIARDHFPQDGNDELFGRVADKIISMRASDGRNHDHPPSTAEYLDTIRACLHFGVVPGDAPEWRSIESAVLLKRS